MVIDHHIGLLAGYGVACAGILALARFRPDLWPRRDHPTFKRPWLEVGAALLGIAGIIAMGQAWQRGWMLPETNALATIVNQIAIFAPLLLVPIIRRQGFDTAWIQRDRWPVRIAVGLALAGIALVAYTVTTRGIAAVPRVFSETYDADRLVHIVQVLLEDIAIAILLVRLGAAIRRPLVGVVLVAALFSLAHIPALTADGAGPSEYALLLGDIALGLIVLSAVYRTQDILWLWPVHATLDLSQFVT